MNRNFIPMIFSESHDAYKFAKIWTFFCFLTLVGFILTQKSSYMEIDAFGMWVLSCLVILYLARKKTDQFSDQSTTNNYCHWNIDVHFQFYQYSPRYHQSALFDWGTLPFTYPVSGYWYLVCLISGHLSCPYRYLSLQLSVLGYTNFL